MNSLGALAFVTTLALAPAAGAEDVKVDDLRISLPEGVHAATDCALHPYVLQSIAHLQGVMVRCFAPTMAGTPDEKVVLSTVQSQLTSAGWALRGDTGDEFLYQRVADGAQCANLSVYRNWVQTPYNTDLWAALAFVKYPPSSCVASQR